MKEDVSEEQRAAALFMANIKECIDSGDYNAASLEGLKDNPTFLYYRAHLLGKLSVLLGERSYLKVRCRRRCLFREVTSF